MLSTGSTTATALSTYVLLTAHYVLLTTYYLLLTTYYLQLTTTSSSRSAYYSSSYYLLLTTYYLLLTSSTYNDFIFQESARLSVLEMGVLTELNNAVRRARSVVEEADEKQKEETKKGAKRESSPVRLDRWWG